MSADVKPALRRKREKRVVQNTEFDAFARRIVRAYARRVADGDVEALTALRQLASTVEDATRDAVHGLRGFGYSWADIAARLGVSRQAAQMRWGAHPTDCGRLDPRLLQHGLGVTVALLAAVFADHHPGTPASSRCPACDYVYPPGGTDCPTNTVVRPLLFQRRHEDFNALDGLSSDQRMDLHDRRLARANRAADRHVSALPPGRQLGAAGAGVVRSPVERGLGMARIKQPGRVWAYTGAIAGGAVSIAANVAHSFLPPPAASDSWSPEVGAVIGAVVWPVFLFIAVEIFARTNWPHGWSWHLLRWAGLLPVAGVAAFVSYRHLSGLLAHYGEEPVICILGPLAVDGLMIMATGALMAGGRVARSTAHGLSTSPASAQSPTSPIPAPAPAPVPVAVPPAAPAPVAPPVPAPAPVAAPSPTRVKARVQARRETEAPKATPTASTPDISVSTVDPARPKPSVTPGQLAKARHIVEAHQSGTGTVISAGELAVRMRCSTEQASRLLAALEQSVPGKPPRDNARNGTAVTSATR